MLRKERYQGILAYFLNKQPNPETELNYSNPFELLVAVILSAQCTDKRVNLVTPKLFERLPSPLLLSEASFETVFELIRSISYPNNKAKHLIGMAKILHNEYQDIIPNDIKLLERLPGVGRKTANVITSVIYGEANMAVDTHVFRVARRIGLSKGTTPLAVEKDLVKHFPTKVIRHAHHWLILHGRYVCVARKPKCTECEIKQFCKFISP